MRKAASDAVFLHCLPRHKEEVDDEVMRQCGFQSTRQKHYSMSLAMLHVRECNENSVTPNPSARGLAPSLNGS